MAERQVRFLDTGYPMNPAGPGGCIGDGSMSGPRGIFSRLLGMRWFHLEIFLGGRLSKQKKGPVNLPPKPPNTAVRCLEETKLKWYSFFEFFRFDAYFLISMLSAPAGFQKILGLLFIKPVHASEESAKLG